MKLAPTPYHRRLIFFLSVATFFEGYDFFALAQILPSLRADLGLTKTDAGVLIAVINAGTMIAALLVRKADVWGRKRVLVVTIAGYTICSTAAAFAPNAVVFGPGRTTYVGSPILVGLFAERLGWGPVLATTGLAPLLSLALILWLLPETARRGLEDTAAP